LLTPQLHKKDGKMEINGTMTLADDAICSFSIQLFQGLALLSSEGVQPQRDICRG
jgi:hypothetical protein